MNTNITDIANNTSQRRIIKAFSPGPNTIRTFQSYIPSVKVGSAEHSDLQINLPSFAHCHIKVEIDNQRVTAFGTDVFCDDILVPIGTSIKFSKDSIIRIHHIIMGFYLAGDDFDENYYNEKIMEAVKKYKQLSSEFQISYRKNSLQSVPLDKPTEGKDEGKMNQQMQNTIPTLDSIQKNEKTSIFNDRAINDAMSATKMNNFSAIGESYDKAVGNISSLPPVSKINSSQKESSSDNNVAHRVIEETKKEIFNELHVDPSPEVVEAYIDKKIEILEEDINDAINKDPDISVKRVRHSDLGKAAIDKELLTEAKNELHNDIADEANNTLKSLEYEKFKNDVTDNIKDDVRETLSAIVKEEVQSSLIDTMNNCLNKAEVTDLIAEKVLDIIKTDEVQELVGIDKAQNNSLVEEKSTNNSTSSDVDKTKEKSIKNPKTISSAGNKNKEKISNKNKSDVIVEKGSSSSTSDEKDQESPKEKRNSIRKTSIKPASDKVETKKEQNKKSAVGEKDSKTNKASVSKKPSISKDKKQTTDKESPEAGISKAESDTKKKISLEKGQSRKDESELSVESSSESSEDAKDNKPDAERKRRKAAIKVASKDKKGTNKKAKADSEELNASSKRVKRKAAKKK